MIQPLPDYKNLDASGEARQAALRMEARAGKRRRRRCLNNWWRRCWMTTYAAKLEIGCGTAALSRRIAQRQPHAHVYAADKSAGMLQMAQELIAEERLGNIQLTHWDVLGNQRPRLPTLPLT
ncbi:MAG: class I SAM-dependent methyltransferase [Caldilineaceae bacterium]